MSDELYKRFRPKTFKDIVGQEEATGWLHEKVKKRKLPHSLLFQGPSGCGKTTLARILASKLSCGKSDLSEINAASTRGVDDIRAIERRMNMAPVQGPCRIWIVDECHKLTNDAQNALLKPLEDTPKHVYFFLCTTDPGKLLQTIKTRCSKVSVKLLSAKQMEILLKKIIKKAGLVVSDEVVDAIIANAQGSARDALVLLDQIQVLEGEQAQLEAVTSSETKRQAFDICKLLISQYVKWPEVAKFLKEIDQPEENIRRIVLGYATTVLLGNGKSKDRAYLMINAFRDPYYDCGKAGLVASCYEVVTQK